MTTQRLGPELPRAGGTPPRPRFQQAAALAVLLVLAAWPAPSLAHLRFAIQEFEPFTYFKDGIAGGAAVECVRAVCASMDEQCIMDIYPWPRAQVLVGKGELDGLFVLAKNPARTSWLVFSPPLVRTEYGFFARKGSGFSYTGPKDLADKVIGVFGPSNTSYTLEQLLKDVPTAQIDMRPDDESGFVKLSLGRVGVVFSNKDVGLSIISRLGIKNVAYAGRQNSITYYVAFSRHADPGMVERFNQTLARLQRDGTIGAILARHGMQAPASTEAPQ